MGAQGASARDVARRVLTRVHSGGAYTSLALSSEMRRSRLNDKDRRLATELSYGVLRHLSRIDRALNAFAHKGIAKLPPAVLLTMRVAAYQLIFLDRIPAHAAVHDAVNEAKRVGGPKMGGFANGLLRKLIREGEPPLPSGDEPADVMVRHSMPDWLVRLLVERVGSDELEDAALGFQSVAPLYARVNRKRIDRASLIARLLEGEGAEARPVEQYDYALELVGLGSPENSASFSEGLWTVQDLSAQLVGAMAEVREGQWVLDACAGVGGKATHLAEALDSVHIDAVDLSQRKLELLQSSSARLGLSGIHILLLDATRDDKRLAQDYDLVLLDAPCSGLGVLRRHPERKWMGEPQREELIALQARLLDAGAKRVRPGGYLLYAVCTFTADEGPEQMQRFLTRHPEFSIAPPTEGPGTPPWSQLLAEDGHFESWPHRGGQDAFYALRVQRRAV